MDLSKFNEYLNTYQFFLIVLGGFTLVWSFRHFSHSKNNIRDFEYLGFSTLWGVLNLALYTWLIRDHSDLLGIIVVDPFIACINLALFGFILGIITGNIFKHIRKFL